jgi:transcriptional regulator with XRE-family HTH domain
VYNLRVRMVERGLSIRDIADAAGINRPALYPLLRYEQAPTLDRMVALANALECEVQDLLRPR